MNKRTHSKDRVFTPPNKDQVKAALAKRQQTGQFKTWVSSDPTSGIVRALLELAQECDKLAGRGRGRPFSREKVLKAFDIVEGNGFVLGEKNTPNGGRSCVGTSKTGPAVKAIAKEMGLSIDRAYGLARQVAWLRANPPEFKVISYSEAPFIDEAGEPKIISIG